LRDYPTGALTLYLDSGMENYLLRKPAQLGL
jgi:hypothetical protein